MKDIVTKINEGFETEDNMIVYKWKKQCYAVINTSEYDAPGVAVMLEELDKLGELGFDEDEITEVKKLNVGQSLDEFKEDGVVVVRLQ